MKLFFREEGKGEPLLILHGLFGSSDNWMTLAKKYAKDYRVIVPDARNHGQSPHSKDFSYDHMSDDLLVLLQDLNLSKVNIIGHSMGGKVAMKFAALHPERISKLVVADISPKAYPVHHQTIIEALKSLNLSMLKSRNEADQLLAEKIGSFGERQFLLKNLKRSSAGFEWKMALDEITAKIENIGEGLRDSEIIEGETLFIRGGNSWYIKDEEFKEIQDHFTDFYLETIDDAGHWLHAEKPQDFYNLTMNFLKG